MVAKGVSPTSACEEFQNVKHAAGCAGAGVGAVSALQLLEMVVVVVEVVVLLQSMGTVADSKPLVAEVSCSMPLSVASGGHTSLAFVQCRWVLTGLL